MSNKLLPVMFAVAALGWLAGCGGASRAQTNSSPSESAARPLGEGAFKVEWLEQDVPAKMKAGQDYRIQVKLKNGGNEKWPAVGVGKEKANQVSISYHWLAADSPKEEVHDGERSRLPADLSPGGEMTVPEVTVVAPPKPGQYRLQLTLVQEGVAWFEMKGASTLTRPVEVQ